MSALAVSIREFALTLLGTEFASAVNAVLFCCFLAGALAFISGCMVLTVKALSSNTMKPVGRAGIAFIRVAAKAVGRELTYEPVLKTTFERIAPYILFPTELVSGVFFVVLGMLVLALAGMRCTEIPYQILLKGVAWGAMCCVLARSFLCSASRSWTKIRGR
jgi:hypothetical protein